MKSGIVHIEIICIACPHCEELITESSSGVTNFEEGEFEELRTIITCDHCGERFRKPAVTWSRTPAPTRKA